jgi:hypothetical protein
MKVPRDLLTVAIVMILFGLAEVYTSFSHNFFGISTARESVAVYSSALIGFLYILAGVFLLPGKKEFAQLAIVLLVLDIFGRIVLVVTGFYPTNSVENTVGIVAGTAIAGIFAIYIFLRIR